MRVTEKGQVTIPKHIRERLGIGPGSEVEFVEESDAVRLERKTEDKTAKELAFDRAIERFRGTGRIGLSTEEYMTLIRDRDIPLPMKETQRSGFSEDAD